MEIVVFFLIAFFSAIAASATSQKYCATITSEEAAGASGYVALQVEEGVATYSFNLDLNDFTPTTSCDYSLGLSYHIHSYWHNNNNASAANSYCLASYTGGHYDPNLACSVYSQSSSTLCKDLNRYYPHYNYSCNSTNYAAGEYSKCEIGDISGKNGIVYPTSSTNLKFTISDFMDYLPPYNFNYNRTDLNSLPWTSFIFHCAQNNDRLVCGKLSTTDLSACSAYYPECSSSSSNRKGKFSVGAVAAAAIVPSVVLFAVGIIIGYYVLSKKSDDLLNNSKSSSV
jgi:hypothetical protein